MKILRRIILFLAIILSVLWIEAAHADMSAPEIREFEIVVVNPDGVDYYDYKGAVEGHLEKDEVVIVMYQYTGKYTIGAKESNNYGGHEVLGYIDTLDGFSIVQSEVDPTKTTGGITKLDTSAKARVYASEGVDIYKGPSNVYEKVGHIKKDVILTYDYSINSTGGGVTNIYVNYNGVKGWVEILDGKVLVENEAQYIFRTDVSTTCGTIPRNSITTPKYRTDIWSHQTLFEYNGCEFMHNAFRDDDIYSIITWDSNVITATDVVLYEYADTASNVIGTIPAGSEVKILASNEIYGDGERICYLKYNDMLGWSISNEEVFDYSAPTSNHDQIKIEDTIKNDQKNEEKTVQIDIKKGINLTEFIILCSSGAVLLVLSAVVIIILINKNKVNKINEQK